MTPDQIPAEVKARIEAEAGKRVSDSLEDYSDAAFIDGAEWLYCQLMTTPHIIHPERTKTNQSGQGKKVSNHNY